MDVLISNATKHHSYQAALAAHEAGMLRRFVTGAYYDPARLRTRLYERALRAFGTERDVTRFRSRKLEGLPGNKVASITWPDAIEQLWSRSHALDRILDHRSVTFLKNEVFDLDVSKLHMVGCDLFHGFEQCARYSLEKAKEMGSVTVLDEPVIHRGLWDRLEAKERERLGLNEPKRPYWFRQHVDRKYRELELADYLFVGLDFVRRSFVDAGIPADRVFLVPYGVEVDAFQPAERPEGPTLNILFVGQISWYKGLHYLLDAYERLDADAHLTIIGFLHDEWETYFEDRFRRMKRPVTYLRTVPHAEIQRQFREADVFAFPSLGGGIGLAVYEAMAAGLPVVTSDGDVVIRDGIDGLIVPAEDTDGWARALKKLQEEPELRVKLGTAAAERVREFTWEAYRNGVRAAYAEIASREGHGA